MATARAMEWARLVVMEEHIRLDQHTLSATRRRSPSAVAARIRATTLGRVPTIPVATAAPREATTTHRWKCARRGVGSAEEPPAKNINRAGTPRSRFFVAPIHRLTATHRSPQRELVIGAVFSKARFCIPFSFA